MLGFPPPSDEQLQAFVHLLAFGLCGVLGEVMAERHKQIGLGYDAARDDRHDDGSILRAAVSLAHHAGRRAAFGEGSPPDCPPGWPPIDWPWSAKHWNPKGPRADLIQAIAMLVAEVERMDRAAAAIAKTPEG